MLNLRIFSRVGRQVRQYSLKLNVEDPLQKSALNEMCILVDKCDNYIGEASKENCHRVVNGTVLLHRAFSVFLFNTNNELLMQKRSPFKITFPNHFTNSCCSHPLSTIESERNEENAIGVKSAAVRRLNYELGIPLENISVKDISYITRIIYKSLGDGVWGEHEVDYILFIRKDVPLDPNPNEVSDIRYICLNKFDSFMNDLKCPVTPWFDCVSRHNLKQWWKNLHRIDELKDHTNITSYLWTNCYIIKYILMTWTGGIVLLV